MHAWGGVGDSGGSGILKQEGKRIGEPLKKLIHVLDCMYGENSTRSAPLGWSAEVYDDRRNFQLKIILSFIDDRWV